ncbi:hypothetical protein NDU88_002302 [Pleurodeles waltl]|uniref:Uncharacterized protein n=1 Tax=Pleurodeles waltl TaxID=8319 RepID=A0AAV7KTS7_PLEWA|nr:hypothetical protein NDU88_002302 [Pleurodeles waltl]
MPLNAFKPGPHVSKPKRWPRPTRGLTAPGRVRQIRMPSSCHLTLLWPLSSAPSLPGHPEPAVTGATRLTARDPSTRGPGRRLQPMLRSPLVLLALLSGREQAPLNPQTRATAGDLRQPADPSTSPSWAGFWRIFPGPQGASQRRILPAMLHGHTPLVHIYLNMVKLF